MMVPLWLVITAGILAFAGYVLIGVISSIAVSDEMQWLTWDKRDKVAMATFYWWPLAVPTMLIMIAVWRRKEKEKRLRHD